MADWWPTGSGGEPTDLSAVALDLEGVPSFDRRVYEVARSVPPGDTITYGEVAARLGDPGAAQAVGGALGRNPFPLVVPCHRVLAAGGPRSAGAGDDDLDDTTILTGL